MYPALSNLNPSGATFTITKGIYRRLQGILQSPGHGDSAAPIIAVRGMPPSTKITGQRMDVDYRKVLEQPKNNHKQRFSIVTAGAKGPISLPRA